MSVFTVITFLENPEYMKSVPTIYVLCKRRIELGARLPSDKGHGGLEVMHSLYFAELLCIVLKVSLPPNASF